MNFLIKNTKIRNFLAIVSATSSNHKRGLLKALVLMFFTGLFDLVLIASLPPLIEILLSQKDSPRLGIELINSTASNFADFTGLSTVSIFAISYILIIIIAASIRIFTIYYGSILSAEIGNSFSTKALANVLKNSFLEIIKFDTSWYCTTITTHADHTVFVINQYLELINSTLVSLFILGALFFVNIKISAALFITLFVSYFLIGLFAKSRIHSNSIALSTNSGLQLKSLQETFGSLRTVLVSESQLQNVEKFSKLNMTTRLAAANTQFIGNFPRYFVEAIGILAIVIILVIARSNSVEATIILPTLAALLLASQKLLPSFQRIFTAWASVGGYTSSVNNLLKCLETEHRNANIVDDLKFKFNHISSLGFHDLVFSYGDSDKSILKHANIIFKKGETIGIYGNSGEGKTTLLDIFTGLISPEGSISVNDQLIPFSGKYKINIQYFLKSLVAYVPQQTTLSNSSIKENIISCPSKNKDMVDVSHLNKCASIANIYSFIDSLPHKFDQIIGENGIQLSGGQSQRIAIAKALYSNPDILILDEATSGLDKSTESSIISSVKNNYSNKIVIIVSHNKNALQFCDKIYRLNDGIIQQISLNKS